MYFAASPEITVAPQTYTTVEGEDVLFRCVAQGYPAPAMSWRHSNVTVNTDYHPDYNIIESSRQDGNLIITESELTILSVKTGMSGVVECIATVSPPMESRRKLISAQEPASLTVFGNNVVTVKCMSFCTAEACKLVEGSKSA